MRQRKACSADWLQASPPDPHCIFRACCPWARSGWPWQGRGAPRAPGPCRQPSPPPPPPPRPRAPACKARPRARARRPAFEPATGRASRRSGRARARACALARHALEGLVALRVGEDALDGADAGRDGHQQAEHADRLRAAPGFRFFFSLRTTPRPPHGQRGARRGAARHAYRRGGRGRAARLQVAPAEGEALDVLLHHVDLRARAARSDPRPRAGRWRLRGHPGTSSRRAWVGKKMVSGQKPSAPSRPTMSLKNCARARVGARRGPGAALRSAAARRAGRAGARRQQRGQQRGHAHVEGAPEQAEDVDAEQAEAGHVEPARGAALGPGAPGRGCTRATRARGRARCQVLLHPERVREAHEDALLHKAEQRLRPDLRGAAARGWVHGRRERGAARRAGAEGAGRAARPAGAPGRHLRPAAPRVRRAQAALGSGCRGPCAAAPRTQQVDEDGRVGDVEEPAARAMTPRVSGAARGRQGPGPRGAGGAGGAGAH